MSNSGNGDVTISETYKLRTERLTVVVHRRAEVGGAECERIKLRTAAIRSFALRRGCTGAQVAVAGPLAACLVALALLFAVTVFAL